MSDQEVKADAAAPAVEADNVPKVDDTKTAEEAEAAAPETEETAGDDKPSVKNPPKNMLKAVGEQDERNRRGNRKFDPSTLEESDDPKKIKAQVEFYFGDHNLPTDKFLWNLTDGSANKPVPLKKICEFSRMRRFKPYTAVVAALKESSFLAIDGPEGEETIARRTPYDPSKRDNREERSVYAKGFGTEEPSTQTDLEEFFSKFGEVAAVRLRRTDADKFKGSVFVEFANKESAEKFMTLDPAPKWGEHDLLILWKKDYQKQKEELIKNGELEPSTSSKRFWQGKDGSRGYRGGFRGRGGRRGDGERRGGDSDNWKKRREEDQRNGHRNDRNRDRNNRGRGRGRNGNGDRNGNRDRKFEDKKEEPVDAREQGVPKIQSRAPEEASAKRGRDDDAAGEQPPAKKVDTKEASS